MGRDGTRRPMLGEGLVAAVCVTLLVTCFSLAVRADAAPSDGDGDGAVPSRTDVEAAAGATRAKKRDIGVVRTELLLADQRAEAASIRAAQAFEAWNAARWQLREARRGVRTAEAREALAVDDLADQESAYGSLVAANYEMSPQLSSFATMIDQDGVDGVVEQANTLYNATTSMRDLKTAYEAAVDVAGIRRTEAADARDVAAGLASDTADARRTAAREQDAALAEAAAVAREKDRLIAELATLQRISRSVAARRQAALEQRARDRSAQAAEAAAEAAAAAQPSPDPAKTPTTNDDVTAPTNSSTPAPPQPATPAPNSANGVEQAIAFAKSQIGKPYRWGAAGPGSWDCSGLTMAAWRTGGRSLPHYSVGQYAASTPISAGDLRPGDLVFWGTTANPNSIHHVALYIGNGQIVHAPRTGRPVTQESLHYWIEPNFYARP